MSGCTVPLFRTSFASRRRIIPRSFPSSAPCGMPPNGGEWWSEIRPVPIREDGNAWQPGKCWSWQPAFRVSPLTDGCLPVEIRGEAGRGGSVTSQNSQKNDRPQTVSFLWPGFFVFLSNIFFYTPKNQHLPLLFNSSTERSSNHLLRNSLVLLQLRSGYLPL